MLLAVSYQLSAVSYQLSAFWLRGIFVMQDFRQLRVWEGAHQVALEVYRVTQKFPSDEKYGLVSQMRRSAVSVAVNLAEGCGRGSDRDFGRFVQIAMG